MFIPKNVHVHIWILDKPFPQDKYSMNTLKLRHVIVNLAEEYYVPFGA